MLLFINSCVRGSASRTLRLCADFLDAYGSANPQEEVISIDLSALGLSPLNQRALDARDRLIAENRLNHESLGLARQFAGADKILIGAPYWDLSFPAVLKTYIEHISVNNITFKYSEKGQEGICKAQKLLYITTAGGCIGGCDFGGEYIRGLCGLFGIKGFSSIAAEGLDIWGADTESILKKASLTAEALAENW